MKNYKNDLVLRVLKLYNMYERYIWKHDDVKFNILIQDNTISFYLYNNECDLDNIVLSFSGKENMLYRYISIKILMEMLSDMVVHIDESVFCNRVVKPYLRLIVNDENVYNIMKELVDRQLSEYINEDTDLIKNISNLVINPIFYPNKTIKSLDDRIGITRKLLKNGGIV